MNETRIDRNVVDNILDLRQFGEDAKLIIQILLYFAVKEQRDQSLFELGTFDVSEFCSMMGLKRENLMVRHPHPRHLERLKSSRQLASYIEHQEKDPTNPTYRIFDSVLENALYRLFTENLTFTRKAQVYKVGDEETTIMPLDRIIFLQKLSFRTIRSKSGQTKYAYDYKLNDDFRNNLSLYFSKINLQHYIALRKANIEDLYIYLRNLRDTLAASGKNSAQVAFDYICEIANINMSTPADKKKWLIKKFKTLREKIMMNVELRFCIPSGKRWRWEYGVEIVFPAEELQIIAPARKEDREDILLTNFLQEITYLIKEKYPMRKPKSKDFTDDIIAYLQKDMDLDEKAQAYIAAQRRTFTNPQDFHLGRSSQVARLLLRVKSKSDIKKVICGKSGY